MTATNATTSEASQVKVLVVDDEIVLADLLASALRYEGWEVTTAHTGADAVRLAREISPDLVVLDIMLPDFDGLEVLSKIRRNDPDISVLFLTAKDSIADRVEGLSAGGDDYVTKPFRLAELLARVSDMLRRVSGEISDGDLSVQDIRIDVAAHRAYASGRELQLTAKEFDLLRVLVREAGNVVGRDTLMREVWGNGLTGSTKTLDMHVSWLRRKLGDDAAAPRYISTVRGMGFRFEKPVY